MTLPEQHAPDVTPNTSAEHDDVKNVGAGGRADCRRLRDITQRLARDSDLPADQTHGLVRRALALIIETALEEGRCAVPGVGVFRRHDTPARPGRNPRTGESHTVPARTLVKFRLAQSAPRPPAPPTDGGDS